MSDTNSAYSAPVPSRKIRFHQRRSAEEQRDWVQRQQRSGQTLKQFCGEHGLALSSFYLWKRRFTQGVPGRRRARAGALIEVPLTAPMARFGAEASRQCVVIHFLDGTRMEVGANAEITWLAELVRVLRQPEHEG